MTFKKTQQSRLHRLFFEGFSAMDLAEPLVSFDIEAEAEAVRRFLVGKNFDVAGIRKSGLICGYVRSEALDSGRCGEYLLPFHPEHDLLPGTATLVEVVSSLAINRQCFITILDQPAAIITLEDLEKPPMRMFLFGLISIGEMVMTDILRRKYTDDSWQALLSPARLAKARELQSVRERCGQKVDLIDCLQYGDKGWILSYDRELREALGFTSRREAREALKEMETLRNNLAHTQAIVPKSWQRIVIACARMEKNLERIAGFYTASSEAEPL